MLNLKNYIMNKSNLVENYRGGNDRSNNLLMLYLLLLLISILIIVYIGPYLWKYSISSYMYRIHNLLKNNNNLNLDDLNINKSEIFSLFILLLILVC